MFQIIKQFDTLTHGFSGKTRVNAFWRMEWGKLLPYSEKPNKSFNKLTSREKRFIYIVSEKRFIEKD